VIADLDTLLTALYAELTDWIIPSSGSGRSGPGRPPEVTDAELVCLAAAQVLLRYDDERHWLRAAARQVGHLFPRLLRQSEDNDRAVAIMEGPMSMAVRRKPRPARRSVSWPVPQPISGISAPGARLAVVVTNSVTRAG
jgi:hypothetical protein